MSSTLFLDTKLPPASFKQDGYSNTPGNKKINPKTELAQVRPEILLLSEYLSLYNDENLTSAGKYFDLQVQSKYLDFLEMQNTPATNVEILKSMFQDMQTAIDKILFLKRKKKSAGSFLQEFIDKLDLLMIDAGYKDNVVWENNKKFYEFINMIHLLIINPDSIDQDTAIATRSDRFWVSKNITSRRFASLVGKNTQNSIMLVKNVILYNSDIENLSKMEQANAIECVGVFPDVYGMIFDYQVGLFLNDYPLDCFNNAFSITKLISSEILYTTKEINYTSLANLLGEDYVDTKNFNPYSGIRSLGHFNFIQDLRYVKKLATFNDDNTTLYNETLYPGKKVIIEETIDSVKNDGTFEVNRFTSFKERVQSTISDVEKLRDLLDPSTLEPDLVEYITNPIDKILKIITLNDESTATNIKFANKQKESEVEKRILLLFSTVKRISESKRKMKIGAIYDQSGIENKYNLFKENEIPSQLVTLELFTLCYQNAIEGFLQDNSTLKLFCNRLLASESGWEDKINFETEFSTNSFGLTVARELEKTSFTFQGWISLVESNYTWNHVEGKGDERFNNTLYAKEGAITSVGLNDDIKKSETWNAVVKVMSDYITLLRKVKEKGNPYFDLPFSGILTSVFYFIFYVLSNGPVIFDRVTRFRSKGEDETRYLNKFNVSYKTNQNPISSITNGLGISFYKNKTEITLETDVSTIDNQSAQGMIDNLYYSLLSMQEVINGVETEVLKNDYSTFNTFFKYNNQKLRNLTDSQYSLIVSKFNDFKNSFNVLEKNKNIINTILDGSVITSNKIKNLVINETSNWAEKGDILSVGLPNNFYEVLRKFSLKKCENIIQLTVTGYDELKKDELISKTFFVDLSLFPIWDHYNNHDELTFRKFFINPNNDLVPTEIGLSGYTHPQLPTDIIENIKLNHKNSYIIDLYLMNLLGMQVDERSFFDDNLKNISSELSKMGKMISNQTSPDVINFLITSKNKYDRVFHLFIPRTNDDVSIVKYQVSASLYFPR